MYATSTFCSTLGCCTVVLTSGLSGLYFFFFRRHNNTYTFLLLVTTQPTGLLSTPKHTMHNTINNSKHKANQLNAYVYPLLFILHRYTLLLLTYILCYHLRQHLVLQFCETVPSIARKKTQDTLNVWDSGFLPITKITVLSVSLTQHILQHHFRQLLIRCHLPNLLG